MKHRKLRIAWSIAWSIITTLLIALWLRSYHSSDTISIRDRASGYYTFLGSNSGTLFFHRTGVETFVTPGTPMPRWYYHVEKASKPQAVFVWNSNLAKWPIGISFPYWLPVILTAATAAATSAFPRLRLRFSLRALLIAATVIAVGLGLITWATGN